MTTTALPAEIEATLDSCERSTHPSWVYVGAPSLLMDAPVSAERKCLPCRVRTIPAAAETSELRMTPRGPMQSCHVGIAIATMAELQGLPDGTPVEVVGGELARVRHGVNGSQVSLLGWHAFVYGDQCEKHLPAVTLAAVGDSESSHEMPPDSDSGADESTGEPAVLATAAVPNGLAGGPQCCTGGDCCGPGSYCCANTGPHKHPEIGASS